MTKPSSKPLITTYDDGPDNAVLSDVVERNIRSILRLRAQSARDRGLQERVADAITSGSGVCHSSTTAAGNAEAISTPEEKRRCSCC